MRRKKKNSPRRWFLAEFRKEDTIEQLELIAPGCALREEVPMNETEEREEAEELLENLGWVLKNLFEVVFQNSMENELFVRVKKVADHQSPYVADWPTDSSESSTFHELLAKINPMNCADIFQLAIGRLIEESQKQAPGGQRHRMWFAQFIYLVKSVVPALSSQRHNIIDPLITMNNHIFDYDQDISQDRRDSIVDRSKQKKMVLLQKEFGPPQMEIYETLVVNYFESKSDLDEQQIAKRLFFMPIN